MKDGQPRQLLNVNRLRVGDILLSRPKGLESWLIAKLGGSRFSHSELVVGESVGGSKPVLSTYEATTDKSSRGKLVGLVREARLADCLYRLSSKHSRASQVNAEPLVLAKDMTQYVEFAVLRSRHSKSSRFESFQKSLKTMCRALHLQPYGSSRSVAQLTAFPAASEFLGRCTGFIPDHIKEGLFCSQLVAKIYEEGGFPLKDLSPEKMAPRHLDELAQGPDAPLSVVPWEHLRFVPGRDYKMVCDWRTENRTLNQMTTDTADSTRRIEKIEDAFRKLSLWLARKIGFDAGNKRRDR